MVNLSHLVEHIEKPYRTHILDRLKEAKYCYESGGFVATYTDIVYMSSPRFTENQWYDAHDDLDDARKSAKHLLWNQLYGNNSVVLMDGYRVTTLWLPNSVIVAGQLNNEYTTKYNGEASLLFWEAFWYLSKKLFYEDDQFKQRLWPYVNTHTAPRPARADYNKRRSQCESAYPGCTYLENTPLRRLNYEACIMTKNPSKWHRQWARLYIHPETLEQEFEYILTQAATAVEDNTRTHTWQ